MNLSFGGFRTSKNDLLFLLVIRCNKWLLLHYGCSIINTKWLRKNLKQEEEFQEKIA